MKITVIGTGYVGLVAGACFADTGNDVVCVDKDQKKIENLKNGIIPIYEPGLETLVERGVAQKRLSFTTSTSDAVKSAEIIFLAVGTPSAPNGDVDMQYVKAAVREIGESMNGYKLLVNKSTVPVGTQKAVTEWLSAVTKHPFDVVSNPEFLKEGTALDDFLKPDRVVIGTNKEDVYRKMAELYGPFVRQGNPIIWMDPVSAEITKYACNAFLATRISFMNELAILCEKTGGDVEEVRRGMTTDVRIGKHFLYAGVGYGGSCFPKDVKALMSTGKKNGIELGIVTAAEDANARQKKHLASKVKSHFAKSGDSVAGKTFGVWGLAFKPNTDDMREAPALVIIDDLIAAGAKIRAFDPVAIEKTREIIGTRDGKVTYCESAYDAAQGCDALLLVTEWNEFRHPDFAKVKSLLKAPLIFDGRNIYNPASLAQQGFEYKGIGRG